MEHPIRKETVRFKLAEHFDYLVPGEIYRGTFRGGYARIDRDDESAGTFLQRWQWSKLLSGAAGFEIISEGI